MISLKQSLPLLFVAILLLITSVLSGCKKKNPDLQITIEWPQVNESLKTGTNINYSSINIGEIVEVSADNNGKIATHARVRSKYSHYIKKNTFFTIRQDNLCYIEAISPDGSGAPVESGAILKGIVSQTEVKIREFFPNTKQTLIFLATGIVLILFVLMTCHFLFKMWTQILVLMGGIISAIFLSPYLQVFLVKYIQFKKMEIMTIIISFFIGIVVSMVIFVMCRTARKNRCYQT